MTRKQKIGLAIPAFMYSAATHAPPNGLPQVFAQPWQLSPKVHFPQSAPHIVSIFALLRKTYFANNFKNLLSFICSFVRYSPSKNRA